MTQEDTAKEDLSKDPTQKDTAHNAAQCNAGLDNTVEDTESDTQPQIEGDQDTETAQCVDSDSVPEAEKVSAGVLSSMNQALEASKLAEQEAKEQLVRMQAEMQNVRRRSERDVESAHKFALEKFATDLLPVFDSLERGLESVPDDDPAQQAAREGLALTHKLLVDTLARFKIETVNPQGEPFNPELHEAISMQPSDQVADNHVLNVFQKGFTLNGRLIRPAMVVVSKG